MLCHEMAIELVDVLVTDVKRDLLDHERRVGKESRSVVEPDLTNVMEESSTGMAREQPIEVPL
jgi:hypothetical protein